MIGRVTEDVELRAQAALGNSPIYDLRDLQVDRVGASLMLSGRVDSFYHKQLAQEVVRAAANGLDVINSVTVYNGVRRAK